MRTLVLSGILAVFLVGCGSHAVDSTPPLASIVTKEVKVPVAACPTQMDQIVVPARPHLPIYDLSPADNKDYQRVGAAYMQSVNSLMEYSESLENALKSSKDICRSVNTTISGQ